MEKIGKKITIVLWALVIISAILIVSLMANISENDNDPDMLNWINVNLIWVYILGILGAGLAIVFALYQTLTSAQAAKKGLISIGFLAVVLIISYVIASPEIPKFIGVDKFIADGLNGSTMKLVDAGLKALYILLGISVFTLVFGPLFRLVKK